MSLVDDIVRQAVPSLLTVFGDPVTLPDDRIVQGIFAATGATRPTPWPTAGLALSLAAQPSPAVELPDADAAALVINDRLVIGGQGYLVTATPQGSGAGLTRVELMLDTTTADTDPEARWQ